MEKLKILIIPIIIIGILLSFNAKKIVNILYSPEVIFDKYTHEFDTLYNQADAEIYFVYTNAGNSSLQLTGVQTGCGCTIPVWNKNYLKPNQKDSIQVVYNVENEGHFIKETLVFSNSKSSPHHLEISGYVPFSQK